MDSWHSFPKVYALGHKALSGGGRGLGIFDGPVVVQEKVDGSQLSFGRDETGKLWIRSRGRVFDIDAPDSMFRLAAEAVKAAGPSLTPGWTYRGEYLNCPKHNALQYDRTPRNCIVLFDISVGLHDYTNYDEVAAEAERLHFDVVPLVWRGPGSELSVGRIEEMLNRTSFLGGMVEGLVVKNYSRFTADGHVMMGKYVTEAFKEVHKRAWTRENPTQGDILDGLLDKYRTEARWHKAAQHLREAGTCNGDPSDIGPLIQEIRRDFVSECKAEVQEELWAWAKKRILDRVSHGAPEWYKHSLLEGAFVP